MQGYSLHGREEAEVHLTELLEKIGCTRQLLSTCFSWEQMPIFGKHRPGTPAPSTGMTENAATRPDTSSTEDWDIVLRPKNKWFQADVKGIWRYRDLLMLFVRRDFVAAYKQTILGPLWMVIQPVLTALLYYFIFSMIARIPTGGAPPLLFYLCGYVPWSYFSDAFQRTSSTFTSNANIFGKVYFPRLVTPVSAIISAIFRFVIQLGVLTLIYLLFYFRGADVHPTIYLLFVPVLLLLLAGFALAVGLLFSSLTTRYRDLNFLTSFILQLGMYGSAVVFPLSLFSNHGTVRSILECNPMLWVIEAFRYALLGIGEWSWMGLAYAAICVIVLLFLSLLAFGRVEKTFMDTV